MQRIIAFCGVLPQGAQACGLQTPTDTSYGAVNYHASSTLTECHGSGRLDMAICVVPTHMYALAESNAHVHVYSSIVIRVDV